MKGGTWDNGERKRRGSWVQEVERSREGQGRTGRGDGGRGEGGEGAWGRGEYVKVVMRERKGSVFISVNRRGREGGRDAPNIGAGMSMKS